MNRILTTFDNGDVRITYDHTIDSLETLLKHIGEAREINKSFFEKDIQKLNFKLYYSRAELDDYCKKDFKLFENGSPDWFIGYSKNGKIGVVSEEKIEEVSNQTKKKSTFTEILLPHEIAHLFTEELYSLVIPAWLNEGIACTVEGKRDINACYKSLRNDNLARLNDLHNYQELSKHNTNLLYTQGFLFTKWLFDTYKKKTVFSFLNALGGGNVSYKTVSDRMFYYFEERPERLLAHWEQQTLKR